MKPIFIIGVLIFLLLIVPVSADIKITAEPLNAEEVNYDSTTSLTWDGTSGGLAIQRIGIDAPTGTTVNFTVYYGNGDIVSGWVKYTNNGFYQQASQIYLGGQVSNYHYVGLQEIGRFYVAGYAVQNNTIPGLVVYGSTAGLSAIQNDYVFYQTSTSSDGVMYKIVLTSNKNIDVSILTNPRGEVASVKNKGLLEVLNDWVKLAIEFSQLILDFLWVFFTYLKFFFWDNLLMVIALYIALTGAVAVNQSRDIFAALRKFFGYQRTLYEFIIGLFNSLVDILNKMANTFK